LKWRVRLFNMSGREVVIEHQERDIAVLRDLFVSRIMTLSHIAALHFDGRGEAAKKRIQKLKAAGFIAERPRKARDPGILYLTKRGFDLLTDDGHLSEYPRLSDVSFSKRVSVSDLTLRHELAVMDAKASLVPAIRGASGLKLVEFCTWPMLCQFDVHPRGQLPVRVKPDGLIRIEEQTGGGEVYEHAFFLEVDRGTETLDTLSHRSLCYREHYSSGGYAASLGAPRSAFTEYPFRVLIVLPSEERRNNLAERLLSLTPSIETLTWLGTSGELSSHPLGSIWIRPRDYRDAIAGTDFAGQGRGGSVHRRRPEREQRIREAIKRQTLFGGE
jgi:hypothetical protein